MRKKGLARKVFLRRKFFSMRKIDTDTMQEHINKLTLLAQQIRATGSEIGDDEFAMTLLCSLPDEYDHLIVALETRADELSSDTVITRLLQEEERRNESSSNNAALMSKGKGKYKRHESDKANDSDNDKRQKQPSMRLLRSSIPSSKGMSKAHCGGKGK